MDTGPSPLNIARLRWMLVLVWVQVAIPYEPFWARVPFRELAPPGSRRRVAPNVSPVSVAAVVGDLPLAIEKFKDFAKKFI